MAGRILIVDDDRTMLHMLGFVLDEEFSIRSAASAEEALDLLDADHYDVVLTDLGLPGMSGLEFIEIVLDRSAHSAVVVVSAEGSAESAVRALKAGAVDYVTKPIEPARFLALIRRVMDSRRLQAATTMYQATRAVTETLDPEALPVVLVEVAAHVMDADYAVVLVPDGEQLLRFDVTHAHREADDTAIPIELYRELAWAVAPDRRALRLPADADQVPNIKWAATLDAILYPLVTRGVLQGVLCLGRTGGRPFSTGDMERAAILASQATLAFSNARLVRSLQLRLEALGRAKDHLTSAERMVEIGKLATGLAHVLQAPVGYLQSNLRGLSDHAEELQSFAQLLESVDDVNTLRRAWTQVGLASLQDRTRYAMEATGRIERLAGDLSRLARERNDVELDLAEVINSAVRLAEARTRATIELDLNANGTIRGNAGQLAQAIVNVIVNADQALEAADVEPVIHMRTRQDGRLILEIEDAGVGIAAEHIDAVIEPFFSTRQEHGATGLGLTTTRSVVERSGGRLSLVSRPGEGTVVRIVFPNTGELLAELELEQAWDDPSSMAMGDV